MILPVVAYGHPVLKKIAEEITPDYPGLQQLIADMFETMYHTEGVGLAAPQINKSIRLFVIDAEPFHETYPEAKGFKKVFINPEIVPVEKNGKVAITNYRTLDCAADAAYSAVECRIETGRTHQIRVHMAGLGCPVIGDRVYGKSPLDRKISPFPARQMLHAWRLSLRHPVSGGQIFLEAPVPDDMLPYFSALPGDGGK